MILRAVRWLPVLAAAAYVATVATLWGELVRSIAWNTDNSGAFTLAARLRGSGPVTLPHAGYWTSFWWMLATRWIPDHRVIWEATGYAFVLATAVVLGLTVGRVAGRWAGMTAGAATLLVGPFALPPLMTVINHAQDPFTATVLGGYLLLLTRTRSWLAAVIVGLVAGTNASSDPLVWIAAVLPFGVAGALLTAKTRSGEIGRRVAATVGIAVAAAVVTDVVMHRLGYHVIAFPHALGSVGEFPTYALQLGRMIALLGGANYAFAPGYPREPLRTLIAVLAVAAVVTPVFAAVKVAVRRAEPDRFAFTCYWAGVALAVCIAVAVTPNASDLGPISVTYTLALAPAAAAGVALLAARSRVAQGAAAIAIAIVGATNVAGITNGRADGNPPLATYEKQLLRVLEHNHITRGFAGYWDAQNLTWETNLRLLVAPVTRCTPTQLCPYNFTTIRSWYEPRGGPTFLLLDDTNNVIAGAPPFVRDSRASYRFGPLTLYLFDYDIARHIA